MQETRWLSELADSHPEHGFPHAIIGRVDLSKDDAEAVIEDHMKVGPTLGLCTLNQSTRVPHTVAALCGRTAAAKLARH